MTLVVDASVAVKWYFEERNHLAARAILERDHALHAPSLVLAEIANATWKRFRRGEMTRDQADDVIRLMAAPFTTLMPIEELTPPAARLALDLNHPVYDCFYLALAARLRAPLVTADQKDAALADRIGVKVELLA